LAIIDAKKGKIVAVLDMSSVHTGVPLWIDSSDLLIKTVLSSSFCPLADHLP